MHVPWSAVFLSKRIYLDLLYMYSTCNYNDKKEKKISLIYKETPKGSGARSYTRKGFLIYEEMRKYLVIYEEVVSHI